MDLVSYPKRSEVWLVNLEPTIGSEIKKRCEPADVSSAKERAPRETRPCIIISPNETNRLLRTVIVAPLTSTIKSYPTRLTIVFQSKESSIALDQMRSVDKSRLLRNLGNLSLKDSRAISNILVSMFTY